METIQPNGDTKYTNNNRTLSSAVSVTVADLSPLHHARLEYFPRHPPILKGAFGWREGKSTDSADDAEEIKKYFPNLYGQPPVFICPNRGGPVTIGKTLKIGVVLSGGPAPGGHNVISGLFDYLRNRNIDSVLYGFLNGPSGIVNAKYVTLDEEKIYPYRNQGGFHIIGSDRTKIETPEQFMKVDETVKKLDLDGLVVIGGDDSNTNAAILAEHFVANNTKTKVIGVPKTIDGDLRNAYVETSFGFDTAVKVYSELVSNLGYDAISAKKSWHFCRLMGRSASHITLEVALQTHPNMALIGEEVMEKKQTLTQVTKSIADLVMERAAMGKNFGVVLLPEGLVEFMPDVDKLILELNEILAGGHLEEDQIIPKLTEQSKYLFQSLPPLIAKQLTLDRDPHGNVQVSKIESERLLIQMVSEELKERKKAGQTNCAFSPIPHFFGYEGRCSLPSNFDCNYCYTLGHTAGALIEAGRTGLVATVRNLTKPPEQWEVGGYPLTVMMDIERRKGKNVPVVKKALVDLKGEAFRIFSEQRDSWRLTEDYRCPGPIQHFGPMADVINFTLMSEAKDN
eukprot:jgi/Galph1/3193/GphlegSOOS_G1824.1